ncbi:unnamed protein product [Aphanomyces euteiches]
MSNNPRGNIFRHVGIYQVCVVKSTEVEMESESVMDLVPFQAPRLAGSALSFFAALTRLPGLGSILLNKVKTDNQFHVVREFASTLDNMPVYLPLRPPTADVLLEHFRLASSFSLDDLAKTIILGGTAMARRLVPLAIGLDGGGSVRIPAALCGVVGLKATYMRVPFNI